MKPLRVTASVAAVALATAACGGSDADTGPRGSIVYFEVRDLVGLVLRPVDGKPSKRIRLRPELWGAADFTRDGERIVYAGERGLYVADADGANVRYIRGQPFNDTFNDEPAWSPDGRRIVFSNGETLFAIAADGGDLRRIGPGTDPDWSPTGDLIVFVRDWDPNAAVWDVSIARSDGSGVRALARGEWPSFSPDGRSVAYSDHASAHGTIYVLPVEGGRPRVVTRNGYAPVWSPDGRYLAFARLTACGHAVCSGRIFVMPVAGGNALPVGPLVGDPNGPLDWIEE